MTDTIMHMFTVLPKRLESMPMNRKLFWIMTAISIIPVLLVTTIASINTYMRVYEDTIRFNTESLNWSDTGLDAATEELKNIFYALEFDKSYKQALILWDQGDQQYDDIQIIRERIMRELNQNSFISSIALTIEKPQTTLTASRSAVGIADDTRSLQRAEGKQTNIFFTREGELLYGIHNIHRFSDRELIAQMRAEIKPSFLTGQISDIRMFDSEQIFILNDEAEVITTVHDPELEDLVDLKQVTGMTLIDPEVRDTGSGIYFPIGRTICFSTYDPEEKLSIIKLVPRIEIIQQIFPTIIVGLFVGIICLICAILVSALLSKIIARPVVRLAQRVQDIELANLVLQQEEDTEDELKILEHRISQFVERIRELIHNEYDIKLQARTAQINALQAQINPHFLHNTLQLIGSISLKEGGDRAYTICTSLSSLLRYSIDFDHQLITLQEELTHLEHYLWIQKQRFFDRFTVSILPDASLLSARIPKLTLQPLVENSFNHGLQDTLGDWELSITIEKGADETIHICVRDNGIGMEDGALEELNERLTDPGGRSESAPPADEHSQHIGLSNVNERIKLSFDPGDGIFLRSRQGAWTEVHLIYHPGGFHADA